MNHLLHEVETTREGGPARAGDLDRFGFLVTAATRLHSDVTQSPNNHRPPPGAESDTEARFRLFVESVKDYAMFILDIGGHISTWNPGAQRIKGYRADEIIGKHFSTFYPREEVVAGKCERELEIATREGRFEEEGWRVRKDGSSFWASVTITALRNPDGLLVGFAKVTRDLTDKRANEDAQRQVAAERAALAEKARIQEFQERFLAILGHDLRNPLASIDMGAGLLLQRASDPANARIIKRMRSSSLRMSRMIEQILDLTRTRLAGGLELRRQPMELLEAITRIVDELRAAHPSRLVELRGSVLQGRWDRDRLEQVFSNIIGNALIYGDRSRPVTITATAQGRLARVEVHNDGPPIPAEILPLIFNPFRRGERDSRTPNTEGLGLGLYISNEVVLAHGGSIEVRSSTTEGTTFWVNLPTDR
jgi:PAS domain S-box-containing protein